MERTDALLIERLAPSDAELRRLVAAHHEFHRRISELSGRRWLSEDEQRQLVDLKKRKLQGRDRIEAILRRHRGSLDVS